MVRNPCFQYKGDMGLIPGGRTKIPYALRHSQKVIFKKKVKFVLQLLCQMINI